MRTKHDLLTLSLAPHALDGTCRRSDEDQSALRNTGCEYGRFGEEAVARVNCLCTAPLRDVQNLVHHELCVSQVCHTSRVTHVGLGRRCGADAIRFIRLDVSCRPVSSIAHHRDVHAVLVRFAVDRYGPDAEFARCTDDPAGDLASAAQRVSSVTTAWTDLLAMRILSKSGLLCFVPSSCVYSPVKLELPFLAPIVAEVA